MKLAELGAQWIRHLEDGRRRFVVAVDGRVEANGLRLRCPTCVALNTALVVHTLLLWDASVGVGITPGPDRWAFEGSTFDDLTLDKPVRLRTGCLAAFRIVKGEVQPCS